MAEDIKPETIKKTQDLLGKYFKKPPLTEKLLRKPPFRFLHDIISAVIRETGFLDGLFSEEELNSENIKDKEAKLAYLTKLIEVVKLITGSNLTVRASKIISGQEPAKTNELLQAIGKALDKKVSSAEAIEHYKKNLEKKSKSATKTKSKEEVDRKSASKQSSQIKKETEKSETKKKSSSTGKSEADSEVRNNEKLLEKNVTEKEHQKEENLKKSSEIIDIPPAESVQDKVPSSAQRKKRLSSAKSRQSVTSANSTELPRQNVSSASSAKDKRLDEQPRRKDSASKVKRSHDRIDESEDQTNTTDKPLLVEHNKTIDIADKDKTDVNNVESIKENGTVSNEVHRESVEKSDVFVHDGKPQPETSSWQQNDRPRTSLRPPSARPISARPAAPRMRAKTESIVNEEIPTPMGNISVIVETADTKEDDDDAEDMVVMEAKGTIDSLEHSNHKLDDRLTQEHGHLVAQILETQRELVNTDNVDVLPKKVDIAWETGSKRDREAAVKEIDKLRSTIQTLTRATNPLGKLLDYLQEDVDMMQKELLDWRVQYTQVNEQLEKEKLQTQELIEPMKETLREIDNNMKLQLDKICQTKSRIMKNDEKIQRLLSGRL